MSNYQQNKTYKPKTCKICKDKFVPVRDLQPTCQKIECMIAYGNKTLQKHRQNQSKALNRAKKEFRDSDKVHLKKVAQMLVNKYARLRDQYESGVRCCTCGSVGKMDGGHFLPTSGYGAIRYNTNQIHQQCVNCNQYNGGRPIEYEQFMIKKYGMKYVENLKATKNIRRKYTVEYYQKLIRIIKKKLKQIEDKLRIK
jgi:5-methylcytosine-specific restriction endonuclease McrA